MGAATTAALLLWLVLAGVLDVVYRDDLALVVSASAVVAGLVAVWFHGQPDRRGLADVQAD